MTPEESASMDLSSFCEGGTGEGEQMDVTRIIEDQQDDMLAELDAERIYHDGTALEYLMESAAKSHVGDVPAIRGLYYSYASTFVENCKGKNCMITGEPGAGKSDITAVVLDRLPKYAYQNKKLSDAVLWRMKIQPGTILVFDDQTLTQVMQEILKILKWDREAVYSVADKHKQNELIDYHIPERCPFWIVKVEGSGDDQVWDRTVMYEAESSEEHCILRDAMIEKYLQHPELRFEVDKSVKVCQKIWERIKLDATYGDSKGKYTVVVPFTITGGNLDIRTRSMFTTIIQAHCVLCAPKREMNSNGFLVADIDDAIAALEHMNPLMKDEGGSQVRGLLQNEKTLLCKLAEKESGMYDRASLMEMTGFSDNTLTYACKGRDGKSGLLSKCPAATEIDMRTTRYEVDIDSTVSKSRKGIVWNKELYDKWMRDWEFQVDGMTLDELRKKKEEENDRSED